MKVTIILQFVLFAFCAAYQNEESDKCRHKFCRTGRFCHINTVGDAECVCGGPDFCKDRQKKVCGTDGIEYPSHCELHRTACVSRRRIGVDQTGKACRDFAVESPSCGVEFQAFKDDAFRRLCNEDCLSNGGVRVFMDLDKNSNGVLEENELNLEIKDSFSSCTLLDLITYDDLNEDGTISEEEFNRAFDLKAYVDPSLVHVKTAVKEGSNVRLSCDIKRAKRIIWKRNGVEFKDLGSIKVIGEYALYLDDADTSHSGNYTCMSGDASQTHIFIVNVKPKVIVYPSTQFHLNGSSIDLRCHADGIPTPLLSWKMNEYNLYDDPFDTKTTFQNHNSRLQIDKATSSRDTGAYKCIGENSAGSSSDTATVFIENSQSVPTGPIGFYKLFVFFHDYGYNIHESGTCQLRRQLDTNYDLSDILQMSPLYGLKRRQTNLCSEVCKWGDVIIVKNSLIYAAQPDLGRIIVIQLQDRASPTDVIYIDGNPNGLTYVENRDEIWLISDHSIFVLSTVSKINDRKVTLLDVGFRIEKMWIPSSVLSKSTFAYLKSGESIKKISLETKRFLRNIDCKGEQSVNFLPIGGKAIIRCGNQSTLIDTFTDRALGTIQVGKSFISPDGRILSIFDGQDITVYYSNDGGELEKTTTIRDRKNLIEIEYFPSSTTLGYNFFYSTSSNEIVFIDLYLDRTEIIESVGSPPKPRQYMKSRRTIKSSGYFGDYLASPSDESFLIVNGRRRHIQCKWPHNGNAHQVIWIDPLHL